MTRDDWRPQVSVDTLRALSALRGDIRSWMSTQGVLEVVTPVLSSAAPSDFHLDAFRTEHAALWLQTSPEYPMKRLLAAHGADIYQLAPVFRAGEQGGRHNPEFTMLEWYRVNRDHTALMDDVADLMRTLWSHTARPWRAPEWRSCHEVIDQVLGEGAAAHVASEPFVDVDRVRAHFEAHGRSYPQAIGDDADAAMDLLLDEFVLPTLPTDRITFLQGWPPSQAALARIGKDEQGRDIAERFEVYVGTLELGNGYHELADPVEQRARFEGDLRRRQAHGRETLPLDENLLQALEAGLPDCAGVAFGFERLAMMLLGKTRIEEVMAFGVERA